MSTTTKRAQYRNMTVAEILRNARRGGIAAIAEQNRRQQARMGGASFSAHVLPDPELDIGV